MPRMIELIRSSSVPATLMQAAAKGALSVSPAEMIEILVHLANHNKVFGQQARLTLAGWEEKSSLEAAADPKTPQEVLDYLIASENLRPVLLPALLENPVISEATLIALAERASREVVAVMQQSPRVRNSPSILHVLAENANSGDRESSEMLEQASLAEQPAPVLENDVPASAEEDTAVVAFLAEHAKELTMEGEKPFQPLGGIHEFELHSDAATGGESTQEEEPSPAPASVPAQAAAAPAMRKAHHPKKPHPNPEADRGSALQKISKLDVKGRIQLAMKGTKEDRSILIRDGTKLVALAVLESGKITDGEVEKFAGQKNVLEAVLRQIPMKRRFAKNYNVVRNLVANPRTPLDVSLGLMKNILISDLRNLSSNKEVSETIRKLALKMYKAKSDPNKKSG